MIYENIKQGKFIERINRFTARVEIDGKTEICHVKNTGRLGELLVSGADIYVQTADNPDRKTKYDLISVYKGAELINIDSQAPNKVFGEWLGNYFENVRLIKPECKYKNSRFDFYIETAREKIFAEIKGVTLEENGIVMFPDAPTERGVKHVRELMECIGDGYTSYIFFIAQLEKCRYFTPNRTTHPEFADALSEAEKLGVNIKCLNCNVKPNELTVNNFIGINI